MQPPPRAEPDAVAPASLPAPLTAPVLFQRALAHMKLHQDGLAWHDLQAAHVLAPKDKAILKAIAGLKKQRRFDKEHATVFAARHPTYPDIPGSPASVLWSRNETHATKHSPAPTPYDQWRDNPIEHLQNHSTQA